MVLLPQLFVQPCYGDNSFAVNLTTDVFSPKFKKGDILVVRTNISPNDGDFVLIKLNKNKFSINELTVSKGKFFIDILKNYSEVVTLDKIAGVIVETRNINILKKK